MSESVCVHDDATQTTPPSQQQQQQHTLPNILKGNKMERRQAGDTDRQTQNDESGKKEVLGLSRSSKQQGSSFLVFMIRRI